MSSKSGCSDDCLILPKVILSDGFAFFTAAIVLFNAFKKLSPKKVKPFSLLEKSTFNIRKFARAMPIWECETIKLSPHYQKIYQKLCIKNTIMCLS